MTQDKRTFGMEYGRNYRSGMPPSRAPWDSANLQKSMEEEYLTEDKKNFGMDSACDYKSGTMPSCAPLASTYVPMQQEAQPRYGNDEALTRGTLFPGLDLPWMNKVNKTHPYAGTPLGELMALGFIVKELNLYLDTHKNDTQAFEVMRKMAALLKEGQAKYTRLYGPITLSDLAMEDKYTWLSDPWPWEYNERTGD